MVGKGAMQLALGALGFAFHAFRVLDYQDFALTAALNYDKQLVGPFGLADMALLALFGYAAVVALRGKLGVAAGEVLMAVLVGALAGTLMANRQGYLEGAAKTTDGLTVSLLAASQGRDPTTAGDEAIWYVRPVQRALFMEFIDRPYDYVNFGGEIANPTCVERRNRILWVGTYVIWQDQIWSRSRRSEGRREYTCLARPCNLTEDHYDHVHVSVDP